MDTNEVAEIPVALRPIPYPYRALLAICSDLDETPDAEVYRNTMRFLNTTEDSSMGPGVGLEIGNTIYFDMPPDQFSYWKTDERGREMVRALIQSGHIDCLHSFGDLAVSREQVERALEELTRHDCRLRVWIDHAVAPTNFGADIMMGRGDVPGDPAYHADLTCDFGVQYVWRGRVTSVIGQDVRLRLQGIGRVRHPLASAMTLLKESGKQALARCGNRKYELHRRNEVLQPASLRDGQAVWEFLRCNPHWGGVSSNETATGIAQVLTRSYLDRLVEQGGTSILYTHLGKLGAGSSQRPFLPATVQAFRLLADYARDGRVMVTTTRRVLDYVRARRAVAFEVTREVDGTTIELSSPPEEELAGLTFYVSGPDSVRLRWNKTHLIPLRRNSPDETGRESVSIPWMKIQFPDI